MEDLFSQFDTEEKGYITKETMEQILSVYDIPADVTLKMSLEIDADGDEKI